MEPTRFDNLRRGVGIAVLVGVTLPVLAQLVVPVVPLLLAVWFILWAPSLLFRGPRSPY